MSSFNNVLDEIDYYRKSFVSIESTLFQNSFDTNQKYKKRPSSRSTPVNEKQVQRRSSSFSRQSIHINSVPFSNELPTDVPIPNSVVRNSSSVFRRRDSSESEQKRLSKDDIKALIKGAVKKQMNKENETPEQSEANRPTKEQKRISDNETRRNSKLDMERRLSLRRSSVFDKRKSISRSVRRTSEEQAPEIRPSLLEEIRKAIQMENSKENDRKLVIGEEQLEKLEEGSVISKKSDTIASSNAWLEHITERLSLSSKRVSELSNKIAATKKSSRLSVNSDESINNWSQKMSEMDTPTKSKQSITERFKNIEAKPSKQGRDRQFSSGCKTPRSANVSRDSKSRLRRVGSPSVLSDKSSFTYRSDDYSTFSRARKTRSADKERRNSFSNIKVGPAMTRHLEQERASSNTRIKGSRSNLSPSRSNSNSDNKMKDFSTRSGSRLAKKSKTTLQNASTERLNKSGTRSRSNCSVGDARFNPERRSLTKRASLTDLIDLYYSSPTRRSTIEGLQNYRKSISKKDSNNSWGGKVVKDPGVESILSMNKVAKTPKTPESLEKNEEKDTWYAAETPTTSIRSLVSLQGRIEDSKNVDESMNNNDNMLNESACKTTEIKSIMKTCNEDKGENKNPRNEDVEEEKKKSEKGSKRLSLTGAETLVVPSEVQEEQEKKRRKSTRRKSSLPKSVKRKSGDKGVANDNNKTELKAIRKSKEQASVVKDRRLEDIDLSAIEIKRETSQLAGLNIIEYNDDIPKKVFKEPKNVTHEQKAHAHCCKSSNELNSKLMNVDRKLRNNNNIQTIKVYRQETYINHKQILAFENISLVDAHNGVDKTKRASVDKCKTGKKNKISNALHSDRLLKKREKS